MTHHYLGIEIGGTKIQVGLGPDDGTLRALWRGTVDPEAGSRGIREQILAAVPEVLARSGIPREQVRGVGIGFGGPVDDRTRTVIRSHQISGWEDFPLADWVSEVVDLPAVLGNDADVAGLAEALHGAGKGLSPIFYITLGSGIGGGFVIDGEIYRGCGRGAGEIGHVHHIVAHRTFAFDRMPLENLVSGWGLAREAERVIRSGVMGKDSVLKPFVDRGEPLTARQIAEAARAGDSFANTVLEVTWEWLAEALCHLIALLCPRRIVIGGGVSLIGEQLLFRPLRRLVERLVFPPFAGLTEIVPSALGEEVVVHGAIAQARKKLS